MCKYTYCMYIWNRLALLCSIIPLYVCCIKRLITDIDMSTHLPLALCETLSSLLILGGLACVHTSPFYFVYH